VILVRCNRCNKEYRHYDESLHKVTILPRMNGGEIVMGAGTSALLECENDLCGLCVSDMEMQFNVRRYVKEKTK
jgi:hypothetical protein